MEGRCIGVLRGHALVVFSAVFSADGKKIVTASMDKMVKVWNIGLWLQTYRKLFRDDVLSYQDLINPYFSIAQARILTMIYECILGRRIILYRMYGKRARTYRGRIACGDELCYVDFNKCPQLQEEYEKFDPEIQKILAPYVKKRKKLDGYEDVKFENRVKKERRIVPFYS